MSSPPAYLTRLRAVRSQSCVLGTSSSTARTRSCLGNLPFVPGLEIFGEHVFLGALHQRVDVGTRELFGDLRDRGDVDGAMRHAFERQFDDASARNGIRRRHEHLARESSRGVSSPGPRPRACWWRRGSAPGRSALSKPSSCDRNSLTILRLVSELAFERAKASASSSSKNITQGFCARAFSNISARLRSLSPSHVERISEMPMARESWRCIRWRPRAPAWSCRSPAGRRAGCRRRPSCETSRTTPG